MRHLRPLEVLGILARMITQGRFLRRTPFWPREQMRDWQFRRIVRLVQHAYDHIPFYSDLYRSVDFAGRPEELERFARLPVITKDQVIASYPHRMLKAGTDTDELIVSRSSGSRESSDIAYDVSAIICTSLQVGSTTCVSVSDHGIGSSIFTLRLTQ